MTAEEILKKHIDAYFEEDRSAHFEDIPYEVFCAAMQEYAQIKLSEYSTKEPVAWLCERGLHKIVTIEQNEVDWCKENDYTITPLIKK